MKQVRCLHLRGATGALRTATFRERKHFVVPVTMLVEGVVHAINAEKPELVLAEELAKAPKGWNGRPVCDGHPAVAGQQVSANDPRVLETAQFGHVFNTVFVEGQRALDAEAWLDPALIVTGSQAENALRRLQDGKPIEVSVGVYMTLELREGVYNGKKYYAVWREIVPDHLAFLREGDRGACSVDMGCGAQRAATVHLITAQGIEIQKEESVTDTPPQKSLKDRFLSLIRWRNNQGESDLSDSDLRSRLESALRAVEPGFQGVGDVFPADHKVVYGVMPEDRFVILRRSYEVAENGDIKLSDDKEEVEPVTRYEPVGRAAAAPACGCHSPKQGEQNMDRNTRIGALIASGRYKEEDRSWLNNVPEAHLSVFESNATNVPPSTQPQSTPPNTQPVGNPAPVPQAPTSQPTPQPPTTPQQAVQQPVAAAQSPQMIYGVSPVTAEQYISYLPEGEREAVRAGIRAAAARRTELISKIRTAKSDVFSEIELQAKSTDELEKISRLLPESPTSGVVNFARPTGATTSRTAQGPIAPPPSLVQSIQEKSRAK